MADQRWIDTLSRALARGTARRDFLKLASGLALGVLLPDRLFPSQAPSVAQAGAGQPPRVRGCHRETHAGAEIDQQFESEMDAITSCAAESGVSLVITSSYRAPGGAVKGAVVTPVKLSNHHAGHAIDMNVSYTDANNKSVLCNSKCLGDAAHHPDAVAKFLECIKDAGLRWGGDFSTSDPVHIDDGLNLNDPERFKERVLATTGEDCAASQTCCPNGICADLKSDPNNCGGCGNQCGAGRTCCQAVCCNAGEGCCADGCKNLNTDAKNCGKCAKPCPIAGQICDNKRCVCPPGEAPCGKQCCAADRCNKGTCCPQGTTLCQTPTRTRVCCPPGVTCCGSTCCGPADRCIRNTCCPGGRVCGAAGQETCCAAGEVCQGGRCGGCIPGQPLPLDEVCCADGRASCLGACCAAGRKCVDGYCCPDWAVVRCQTAWGPGACCDDPGQCTTSGMCCDQTVTCRNGGHLIPCGSACACPGTPGC